MTYNLNLTKTHDLKKRVNVFASLKKLLSILAEERKSLIYSLIIIIIHSLLTLIAPLLIGYTIDTYVQTRQLQGVIQFSLILFSVYMSALATSYLQTKLMGSVGQRVLFRLRNAIFTKLQELPVTFFNENKAGDLISRINNDTDKLNQFFSQSLMQFIGSLFIMTGAGVFLLSINFKLGLAALIPAIILLTFSKFITPWIKKLNAAYMASTGNLSAEIQESLTNFRVVVAFNRRDYFRQRFDEVNRQSFATALKAGLANSIFVPIYGFFANIGQLIVLTLGIYLVLTGSFSIGLLISFLAYIINFYNPLRQLAALWTSFQIALAGWDRISHILSMKTNLEQTELQNTLCSDAIVAFRNVSFGYVSGNDVLHNISFELGKGKTYAFVGPTGGGKTTTASLIARLYDPNKGVVLFQGKDLCSYSQEERSVRIGFILQEPYLFTGTVKENIVYGNTELMNSSDEELVKLFNQAGFHDLLYRFGNGLDTPLTNGGDTLSLGQKQLIAFMRAVLRKPEVLILDEATANIDTITEQQLEDILQQLPATTTKIIIAHRLNTIENADEIFFINAGTMIKAGSMENAVHLLLHDKRIS